jgi:hypothetical protein
VTVDVIDKQEKAYSKLATAMGKYLKTMGLDVVLVSGARIEHPAGCPKAKFQFCMDFLGSNTKGEDDGK